MSRPVRNARHKKTPKSAADRTPTGDRKTGDPKVSKFTGKENFGAGTYKASWKTK